MLGVEEYSSERAEELHRGCQFIEQNRSFILEHFTAYREKVEGINILLLKLSNHKSTFKHQLRLGILTSDQYQNKIDILDEKLREQEVKKKSINEQFITSVFGHASILPLPPEDIILYLQKVFL